jgi:hypothetical protein
LLFSIVVKANLKHRCYLNSYLKQWSSITVQAFLPQL